MSNTFSPIPTSLLRAAVCLAPILSALVWPADVRAQTTAERLGQMETQLSRLIREGRHQEAERYGQEMIAFTRAANDPKLVAYALIDVATFYIETGRWPEAEPLGREALAILQREFGPDHALTAEAINILAIVARAQGQLVEAERLARRVLAAREKTLGPNSSSVADGLGNLATILGEQGRFAEAEPLQFRCLRLRIQNYGREHEKVAMSLYNLGHFYHKQNRLREARAYFQEALAMKVRLTGGNHPDAANAAMSLAVVCFDMGQVDEAEELYKRSHQMMLASVGPDHPWSRTQNGLAELYILTGKTDLALPLVEAAIADAEKRFGSDSLELAKALSNLRLLYEKRKEYAKAVQVSDRILDIHRAHDNNPHRMMAIYLHRGRSRWAAGQREAAIEDLRRAVGAAEDKRARLSGGEQDRSKGSSEIQEFIYQTAASMFFETGRLDEAFAACEAGRSRTLAEQMVAAHVDLFAGMPVDEARRLQAREADARRQVALLEVELDTLQGEGPLTAQGRQKKADLDRRLAVARGGLLDAYADIRTASPVYRRILGSDFGGVPLAKLQSWCNEQRTLVLYYLAGKSGSWLVAAGGGENARAYPLRVHDELAATFATTAGELTPQNLHAILMDESSGGVLQMISDPSQADRAADKLRALTQLLLPESELQRLQGEQVQRLVIVPDGQLALFPFEACVVSRNGETQYLLDVAPPISYAPSATILMRLVEREPEPAPADSDLVLALGDPAYPSAQSMQLASRQAQPGSVTSRYAGVGGTLSRLPYSGREASWVAQNFSQKGLKAGVLRDTAATEAAVRKYAPGRRILHLACHGLVDSSFGNFFGALALAPGPRGQADPADNGFLTLSEIYELDLRSCELAILSACQTNYGEHQVGEGVWALTRGFLVAGARRVVASDWLVDDEAAASLISYYTAILARQQSEGKPLDYAGALREARQWVRGQEKWQSPYYWGTFVLVGAP